MPSLPELATLAQTKLNFLSYLHNRVLEKAKASRIVQQKDRNWADSQENPTLLRDSFVMLMLAKQEGEGGNHAPMEMWRY